MSVAAIRAWSVLRKLSIFSRQGQQDEVSDHDCPTSPAASRRYSNIVDIARRVAKKDPRALSSMLKTLLRPLQAEQMCGLLEEPYGAPSAVRTWGFFGEDIGMIPLSVFLYRNQLDLSSQSHAVNLSTDLILPTPWNTERYVSAITHIGTDRELGPWTQDGNHSVELWLPWRIAFVHGGNHSISAGILAGEGTVAPTTVYDLSPCLSAVSCDGTFFRYQDGSPCAAVRDPRRAAVFAIGRLMVGLHAN